MNGKRGRETWQKKRWVEVKKENANAIAAYKGPITVCPTARARGTLDLSGHVGAREFPPKVDEYDDDAMRGIQIGY